MNILILSSSFSSGGAETHVLELSLALASLGHTVTVASEGGALADQLSSGGIKHVILPLASHSPVKICRSSLYIRKLLKKENFDIIHTHSRIAALVAHLAARKSHVPIVSTVHAHFRVTPLLRRLSFWGRRSIAVSEDLFVYLSREYNVPQENITVIENGIDTKRFSKADKPCSNSPPHIIFVSRLDTDCSLGALLLIRIAERLSERYPGITIEIIGGGKEEKRLLSLAKKVNFKLRRECVSLTGFCKDVPERLHAADVFVGVSRAALEAMSAGIPTVLCGNEGFLGVLDASIIKKAAKTNFCCRKNELATTESLFLALTTLLDMPAAERRELGEYLRDYVIKHNSLTSMAKRTEEFYKLAIDASPVTLCGYYGAGNLGDDALLQETIKRTSANNMRKIYIISQKNCDFFDNSNFFIVPKNNIGAIKRAISDSSRLILGGGSILQDKSSLRSLIYYTSLIKYAHKKGVRVELLSNGIGPLRRKRARRLAAKALAYAETISLRDTFSYDLAKELGVSEDKLSLEEDLSHSTLPCDDARINDILLALGLSEKAFALISIRKRDSRAVKKELTKYLFALELQDIKPLFAVLHKKEDIRISRRLAKKHGGVVFIPNAEELLGLAKHAKCAVGTRFHLLYLSKLAGIPVYPLGDDPKMKGL